jgi:Ca2+-binding EF-hand superfamily protein
MSVIGENSQMSRDSIRAYFGFYDKNKDGKLTFEEVYPSMLASMKRKGLILTSQAKMLDLSVATMEGDAFSESGSVTGD